MILRIGLMCIVLCSVISLFPTTADNGEVICFSTEFEARMGNLMFQYAAVVGLCAMNNRTVVECAQLIMPRYNDPDTPVPEFVQTFNIPKTPIPGCVIDKTYVEHAESKEAVMFDEALLNISSGSKLHGYLQSYKYFHPHAEQAIKQLYSFSPTIQNQSTAFIHSIRRQLPAIGHKDALNDSESSPHSITSHIFQDQFSHHHLPSGESEAQSQSHTPHQHHSGYKVVGVHVRLGDKLNNPFYNGWSLSVQYYSKAIELVRAQHSHTAFVFFTGGSTNKAEMERDEEWTKKNLAGNITYSFHENSNNHLVALHSLSLCDVIITAHSSYSWWAAYLSNSTHIIAPRHLYPHKLPLFMFEDYYLPHWQLLSEDPYEDRIFGINPFPAVVNSSVYSGNKGFVSGSTLEGSGSSGSGGSGSGGVASAPFKRHLRGG